MTKNIGEEFIEKTKYQYLSVSDQKNGVEYPPLETPYDKTKPIIDLPKPEEITVNDITVRQAIEKRKSVRQYTDKPLSLKELSWLLWATQGVKEISPPYTRRNVPSAGARHAIETYLLINNVEGLKQGIYRYLALEHKLVEYKITDGIREKTAEAAYGQKMVMNGNVAFMWVAIPYRMSWRYSERSYRYLHLDAGHICQNLHLAAEAIDCGMCAIAAYYDDAVNQLLNLDGKSQFVIYMAALGKK
ncbi:MAG: SagB/ThcOx family dehydrogenase [Candidatus Thorarchaeota archaeon]